MSELNQKILPGPYYAGVDLLLLPRGHNGSPSLYSRETAPGIPPGHRRDRPGPPPGHPRDTCGRGDTCGMHTTVTRLTATGHRRKVATEYRGLPPPLVTGPYGQDTTDCGRGWARLMGAQQLHPPSMCPTRSASLRDPEADQEPVYREIQLTCCM